MANWSNLKASVAEVIKTNGNQEITGQVLQNVLNSIISNVGENATYAGIATPTTNPGIPDGNVFYLATEAGTYANFSGIEIADGEAVILEWRGSWAKKTSGFVTQKKLTELERETSLFYGTEIGNITGNYDLVQGSLNVENGNYMDATTRVRTKHLHAPLSIETNDSYQVMYYAKYTEGGDYVNYKLVYSNKLNIEKEQENFAYIIVFSNKDTSKGIYPNEDIISGNTGELKQVVNLSKIQNNKYFIYGGDISLIFSEIDGEYCSIKIESIGEAVILNVSSDKFIRRNYFKDKLFEHVPYRYGMLYAKINQLTDVFSEFVVGRMGIYALDFNVLQAEEGFYYVPIIGWNAGTIIYKIDNYYKYSELFTNLSEFVNNFDKFVNNSDKFFENLVGCFERIVCIGDSITAGYTGSQFAGQNVGSNDARVTARNWPAYFKKITGVDVINLGYGSSATTHWRNSTPETETSNLYCALELANIEGVQAFFIMLGWNDTISVGSASDIDLFNYEENGSTFYGNYDYIVRKLHDIKPKAHIFVFTLARSKKNSEYNEAIRYIASLYPTYCHCIDYSNDPFFDTSFFSAVADSTHYSPLGYNAFGNFVRNLVSKYIYNNPSLFKGIPYTADEVIKGTIDVQGLRLSSANAAIENIGSYLTLFAEVLPNTAANKNVRWDIISGDNSCITLIPNQSTMYCTIKGISQGYAVVRATSEEGGYTATCLIAVAQEIVNVTGISLNKSSVNLSVGSSEESVTATITPPEATNKNIRWALLSGGDSIATIEGTGLTCLITPRDTGTDTLIATTEDGSYEARCSIIVT